MQLALAISQMFEGEKTSSLEGEKASARHYGPNWMSARRWNLVKRFRALGGKIAAFLDFLTSARNELKKRAFGEWAHERPEILTAEQSKENQALKDSLRLAVDTTQKVQKLGNAANTVYKKIKETRTDRAGEVHRLANHEINLTYENFHRISPVKLIPVHERKRKSRLNTYWGMALSGMMMFSVGTDGYFKGLKAAIEFQKFTTSISTSIPAFGSASTNALGFKKSPAEEAEERYEIGKKGNEALSAWVKMMRKRLSPTKIDPPFFVSVPMSQFSMGKRTRELFHIARRHKELKIGEHHVPYH